MKCKLLDICVFRKGKVDVSKLTLKTYISTENMLPNKGGVTEASSLPTVQLTQEYKKGDILVSNIRPYFKKIWQTSIIIWAKVKEVYLNISRSELIIEPIHSIHIILQSVFFQCESGIKQRCFHCQPV